MDNSQKKLTDMTFWVNWARQKQKPKRPYIVQVQRLPNENGVSKIPINCVKLEIKTELRKPHWYKWP